MNVVLNKWYEIRKYKICTILSENSLKKMLKEKNTKNKNDIIKNRVILNRSIYLVLITYKIIKNSFVPTLFDLALNLI